MATEKQPEFTPEQLARFKQANAHGFINHLVTDGIPDPADPKKTNPCAVKEAKELCVKAFKRNDTITKQAQTVKAEIRKHLVTAGK